MIKNTKNQDRLFWAVFLIVAVFLFWKCPYGFGNLDETFYLTVPYRLLQGDALFLNEWHGSQMAGVLTLPFVAAFLSIQGNTDGIILAMRYVFTVVHCLFTAFLYLRLKKMNWLGAIGAAISFMLYVPFGIMALSYNSMGVQFLVIALVILLTAEKYKEGQFFAAGLSFAVSVLCCPYLMLVYLIYLITVAVRVFVCKKEQTSKISVWNVRGAVFFTCGAAFAAILFAAFVLSRCSLDQFLQVLKPILNDPEHVVGKPFQKVKTFLEVAFTANPYTLGLYIAMTAVYLVFQADKQKEAHEGAYVCAFSVLGLLMMGSYYFLNHYINHIMWSINIYALFLALISKDQRMRSVLYTVWVPGMLYGYCQNLASNQHIFAVTSGSSVACIGSFMIMGLYFYQLCQRRDRETFSKLASAMICVVLLAQIGTQVILRYESVFWDNGMDQMTMKITYGIEKGIITSEELYENHEKKQESLRQLRKYPRENMLFLSHNTWFYLEEEDNMAAYSAWLSGVNHHTLDRLEIFYEINPHKMPDLVFIDDDYEDIVPLFCERFSYEMVEEIYRGYVLQPA